MRLRILFTCLIFCGTFAGKLQPARAEEKAKPIKALLVTGGGFHDYDAQRKTLVEGLSQRLNVEITVAQEGTTREHRNSIYEKADWAKGYDVIIHNECSANIDDPAVVNRILDPHRKGVPGVNLHCAMHSYRTAPDFKKPLEDGAKSAMWFDYIGLQSTGHGPQKPISVTYLDPSNPITAGLENWTTINEELYNNIRIHDSAKPLAKGKQGDDCLLYTSPSPRD